MSPAPRRRVKGRVALLLDEMHAPVVAQALRDRGHDVMSVAENPDLRALTDDELFAWGGIQVRPFVSFGWWEVDDELRPNPQMGISMRDPL